MILNTGKVKFDVEFDNGDKDAVYFNPSDPDLLIRVTKVKDNLRARFKEMDDVELDDRGTPTDPAKIKLFTEMRNIFFEEFDRAVGGEVSKVFFKHCSPFALVRDHFFVSDVVDFIAEAIRQANKK